MMNVSSIPFTELLTTKEYNDSNSVVMTGLSLDGSEDWPLFDDFLANRAKFSSGKRLIAAYRITGNIKGEDGRTDYLLVFDNPETQFNPIARMTIDGLKWLSDFVVNYKSDYIAEE